MFQNKHIIRASFVGLFLAILASILFYRYFTINNIVVGTVMKDNNKMTNYYITDVWSKYSEQAKLSEFINLETSLKNDGFRDFASKTMAFFENEDKLKVSLINAHGRTFLSTNDDHLIKNTSKSFTDQLDIIIASIFNTGTSYNDRLVKAFKGQQTYSIILGKNLESQNKGSNVYVESFLPIKRLDSPENIECIVKTLYNITDEWNRIRYFEKRVSVFLLAVFTLFFGVIVFNTQHAQKIIDQQVANNKLLEEAKVKAESESIAKTEFLANVSHELRTPLNAIIGFSEVILTEAYGKLEHPQYSEYIQDINNSGKHLLSVINDILDFSKASADKLKVDIIDVDANKLASSSLRFVKPRADEAKVSLIEKMPKEHVVIKADPKRLKQALLNLLSNSVKFTPENGSVTLELERNVQDKVVNIRVIDTGIGMEEKDIPKALSSFGQVDNKLSRKYEGTGLGLPLTKKLVELMDGKFEVTSKLGVGTTITITFEYEDL